jgi:hypothetical protein
MAIPCSLGKSKIEFHMDGIARKKLHICEEGATAQRRNADVSPVA